MYNLYSQFDNAPFTDQKQIMRLLDEAQKDLEYNKRAHELNQDAGIDYDTTTFLKTTNHAIDQIKFAQNYFQNKDNFDAYQQKMTSKNVNLLEKEQFTQNTKTITPQAPIQMQPSNDTSHPVEIVQRYKKEIENAKFSNSTPYSVVQKTKPDATDNSLSTESPGAENKKEAPNPFSKNPKPYS